MQPTCFPCPRPDYVGLGGGGATLTWQHPTACALDPAEQSFVSVAFVILRDVTGGDGETVPLLSF